jgi:hypothetical protein
MERGSSSRNIIPPAIERLIVEANESKNKPSLFVAMPFASEFDNIFDYGFTNAANAAGFRCERTDKMGFTGDVLGKIKERIGRASIVIADISTSNPNVYLEVGYAWGQGIPTVLVAKKGTEVKFDVQGQKILYYDESIKNLETTLTDELRALQS